MVKMLNMKIDRDKDISGVKTLQSASYSSVSSTSPVRGPSPSAAQVISIGAGADISVLLGPLEMKLTATLDGICEVR